MSDSTGFGAGGVSSVLTVGNPVGGQCNTTDLKPGFYFETPRILQQCREFDFTGYGGATQPITIYGLIPAGDPFILNPPSGPTVYQWTADVAAGTSLMFILIDSKGQQGGATDFIGTGLSDDTSCLNSSSPTSTTHISTQTQTFSQSSTSTPGGSGGHSENAIIGGGVGGGIAILSFLAFLFWWRYRKPEASRRRSGTASLLETSGHRKRRGPIDLLQDGLEAQAHYPLNPATRAEGSPGEYEPVPYVLPPALQLNGGTHGESIDGSDAQYATYREGIQPGGISSTGYSKASEAMQSNSTTANTPTRFILHTDGGSIMGSDEGGDEEEEIVELPPQYDSLGHVILPRRQVSRRLRRSQRRPTTEGEESTSIPPPQVTEASQSPES